MTDEVCKAVGEGRPAGARWVGGPGGEAGRVGRRAGWSEGMDLRSKKCSGVNIVTWKLRRIFNLIRRIFDFT